MDWKTYSAIGDPQVPLTDTGWAQARDAGAFLRDWFNDPARGNRAGRWPQIYVSPFLRTRETLSGVLHGLGDDPLAGTCNIREEARLAEQSFGFLAYADAQQGFLKRAFARAIVNVSQQVYKHSPYLSFPLFGESPMMVQNRVSDFIGTLYRDHDKRGTNDVMIVAHGGVIKAFMMRWFHLPLSGWSDLKTPGNCDVFVIEKRDPEKIAGTPGAGWSITRIYDGEVGVAVNDNPLARVQLFAESRLPQFPDRLKR
ncbi:hypothetical protein A11S_2304 [Micavibrio aeruginosavorus EPB]|uniref:Phosphoglycerate mutase n=1 Tax=Micavibrio aeruginosavorus EPB TaxID=349215 RepID=M4W0Z4_9BACT|nr:hypothetical protein A11S_2304 [Micavibrio aeruginosavorus EPB]